LGLVQDEFDRMALPSRAVNRGVLGTVPPPSGTPEDCRVGAPWDFARDILAKNTFWDARRGCNVPFNRLQQRSQKIKFGRLDPDLGQGPPTVLSIHFFSSFHS
jgi:hypothetical protein